MELSGLTELRMLDLRHTGITDASVPSLRKLKNLEWLYVDKTRFSGLAANELKTALPKLQITRVGGA